MRGAPGWSEPPVAQNGRLPRTDGGTSKASGNTARELDFWQSNLMQKPGTALIAVRMIPWSEEFEWVGAGELFGSGALYWRLGEPLPAGFVENLLSAMRQQCEQQPESQTSVTAIEDFHVDFVSGFDRDPGPAGRAWVD